MKYQILLLGKKEKKKMNKYKIVALFGEAGAGKDYIQSNLMKTIYGKINFHKVISYTTRPPREGERDGVDYFFTSSEEFFSWDLLPTMLEFTNFRDWWYGTSINGLNIDKINIGVFNIKGIDSLLLDDKVDCLPIYIKTYDKIRLLRQLNREEKPNCEEICRRFSTDKEDFKHIPFHYHIIENNTNELNPIIYDINELIREKWS